VKQARAASPAEHGGLSGRDVHLPVLGRNYKKNSYCLDCLLLMQLPRRNVDFSNPGLIGRRREERLLSARVAAGIGVSIWSPGCTFNTGIFSRLKAIVQVTRTL
jgi:hypothetical protein